MIKEYIFDWSNLAFANKKPIKELKAIFISAPREISAKRFTQLIKEYLPQGNIVLGLAKEPYIEGFEDQPQFKALQLKTVQHVIEKVNKSNSKHKVYVLNYFQREWVTVISKLKFSQALFINGSWKYVFHNSPVYYLLNKEKIPYQLISPFCNESEAHDYEQKVKLEIEKSMSVHINYHEKLTDEQMLQQANSMAKLSFDYNFQTGVALGKKTADGKHYKFLGGAANTIVPFETYALHNGASREINFSPSNDLNHYDAVHAEVEIIVGALEQKIDLEKTSLFINLLPCPTCARMLCRTGVTEIVYQNDHSDGYAVKLLEKAGKSVRRLVI